MSGVNMKEIAIQASCTRETCVTEDLLASRVGSGSVDVYATPMMIALMEKAASELLVPYLDEGETSVGIHMDATHDAATPQGMKVSATAVVTAVDRRKVIFSITARDEKEVIGTAVHERFIVNKDKFESKAKSKKS